MAWKKARERYQGLSEQEKYKKCQYACEQQENLSEEKKKRINMAANDIKIFGEMKNKD